MPLSVASKADEQFHQHIKQYRHLAPPARRDGVQHALGQLNEIHNCFVALCRTKIDLVQRRTEDAWHPVIAMDERGMGFLKQVQGLTRSLRCRGMVPRRPDRLIMDANASPERGDAGRDTATEEGWVRGKCMVSCFL